MVSSWPFRYCLFIVLIASLSAATHIPYLQGRSSKPQTVHFEIDLTWEPVSPDGHKRNAVLINGQYPGPTLELYEGDDVEFLVHNHLPFEDTVHFHGIEQKGTPWSDGVPGLTQRPIRPGESFLYKWTAHQYGTYWYHSHDRSHIMDGHYGPILIHPKPDTPKPFDTISKDARDIYQMERAEFHPKLVTIADWSHFTSEEFFNIQKAAGVDNFCSDSVLINGKGSEFCLTQEQITELTGPVLQGLNITLTKKGCVPAQNPIAQGDFPHDFSKLPPRAFDVCEPSTGGQTVFEVDAKDGWANIELISAASINVFATSIDEHEMWIYAADGNYITPSRVNSISIQNGNRYSAMVKLDQRPGDYTIRFANTGINQLLSGFATLRYKGSKSDRESVPSITYTGANTTADVKIFDETRIKPFPPSAPAAKADRTFHLSVNRIRESWQWTLSGKESFGLNLEEVTPLLFQPNSPLGLNENLTITTKLGEWVDIIVQVGFPLQPPHPLHKHSNKGYIIGAGVGAFNWSNTEEAMKAIPQYFNLVDPPLRDGYTTIPTSDQPSWTVLRYHVENPGAFMFHCHIQTHLSGGMAIAILDAIEQFPVVPQEYLNGNGISNNNYGRR